MGDAGQSLQTPWAACTVCGVSVASSKRQGKCVHSGTWHSAFGDCSARCGWALLKQGALGRMHWSCCFSTVPGPGLCASSAHQFSTRAAEETEEQSSMFGKSDVPRYIVNLDAPPRERWTRVIAAHRHHFPAVVDVVKGILGSGAVKGLVESFFALLARSGHLYFGEELQGIADASGLPLGSIVLLQIAYELFAGCTSIVAQSDTHPVHIRTMDWDMDALKPLTCEVEMVRNGRIVFVATTWAGYVGILTGLSPGAFSVSVNYRCTEKVDIIKQILLQNLLSRGLLRRHWPVSFLVRQALESCSSFADAVAALEHSQLMAPVYFTICGTDSGQGIVLARDRAGGSCSSTCLAWPSYRHPMRSGSHSSADDGPLGGTWETALAELDLAVRAPCHSHLSLNRKNASASAWWVSFVAEVERRPCVLSRRHRLSTAVLAVSGAEARRAWFRPTWISTATDACRTRTRWGLPWRCCGRTLAAPGTVASLRSRLSLHHKQLPPQHCWTTFGFLPPPLRCWVN